MLQFGASLTDDTRSVNYDCNTFIIQATVPNLNDEVEQHWGWVALGWETLHTISGFAPLPPHTHKEVV